MADLMTGTYSFDELKKKYDDFQVSACKIKVEGTNVVDTEGFYLEEMEINLSLNAAGSVTFRLIDCYDLKNSTFDNKVKSKMVLGRVIEVEIGYLSDTTKVFKGYISSVGIDFDNENGVAYEITAMDVRRLMMSNYHYVMHEVKNYSEAFETVMSQYKKLCSVIAEATSDNLEVPFAQSLSDYDFVREELIGKGYAEREFFVLGDKAYFRKPQSSKDPIMTLEFGSGILGFKINENYLNQKVAVIGYDPTGKKEIKGEKTAKAQGKQVNALSEPGSVVVVDSNIDTEKKAKDRAASIAGSFIARSVTGIINCIGLPEIVPGRFIKLNHIDSAYNKKYYITDVKHSLSQEGFVTSFEIGGAV